VREHAYSYIIVEPFDDGIFHFTDATQVSEVLLKHVSVRSKLCDSIVILELTLLRDGLGLGWSPDHRARPECTLEREKVH